MATPVGDPAPVDRPVLGGGTPAPRRAADRRRRWFVVALVVAALVALAIRLWWPHGTREVTPEEALGQLGEPATTSATEVGELRPAAGVYRYEGVGTEALSLPPRQRRQGPSIPGTVTHLDDGCWTFRVDLNSDHWQDWTSCPRPDRLVELGGASFTRWDFGVAVSETTSTFRCEPPAVAIRDEMRPGDAWEQRCTGTSSGLDGTAVSAGTLSYVGPETVDVDGRAVPTHRFRQERTVSGAQQGEQVTEVWLSRDDGLPVRNDRRISVATDTPIGSSTCTEEGSFRLVDPEPTG
jgi:hypothetical protein